MTPSHGLNPPVTRLQHLPPRQHLQLLVALLTFFEADPAHPDAHRVGDMLTLEALQPYDKPFLREMVASLRSAGLLYKLPRLHTRASSYITTTAGLTLRDSYLQQLGR